MSDVTAAGPAPAAAAPTGGFQFPSLNALGTMLKRGDIVRPACTPPSPPSGCRRPESTSRRKKKRR
jgi:hypothetical protein